MNEAAVYFFIGVGIAGVLVGLVVAYIAIGARHMDAERDR